MATETNAITAPAGQWLGLGLGIGIAKEGGVKVAVVLPAALPWCVHGRVTMQCKDSSRTNTKWLHTRPARTRACAHII